MSLRLGYGTNGFADHQLREALDVIGGLGFEGVGLTLDHHHLDPFADDLPGRARAVRGMLAQRGLSVVVETGGRYVLDPQRKHEPTLVCEDGRSRRVDLLARAIRVAGDLGAPVVSFWSGALPTGTLAGRGTERLVASLERLVPLAETEGVRLALEPEPGHHVALVDEALAVLDQLGRPDGLGITVDVGHAVCNEPRGPGDTLRRAGDRLLNVQLDDMLPGVHEHLEFGQGDVDLVEVLATLLDLGYQGLAAVELPRHSHAAPLTARRAAHALQAALARVDRDAGRPAPPARPGQHEASVDLRQDAPAGSGP